jgi:hypothetical protein
MNKITQFFDNRKELLITELIKSCFLILVAVISVTFWEKQKILNEVSFTKKLEILSEERKALMDNANRFSENWEEMTANSLETGLNNCLLSSTYKDNYDQEQLILQKTDMIIANNIIENDQLKELQNQLVKAGDELAESMGECKLDDNKYNDICQIYDKIINIYSKEIIKEIQ